MPLGLCRIKDGWTNQDSVLVRYKDGTVQELSQNRYVELRYLPSIGDLISCPGNALLKALDALVAHPP